MLISLFPKQAFRISRNAARAYRPAILTIAWIADKDNMKSSIYMLLFYTSNGANFLRQSKNYER
jgi:hypothetical protein